MASAKLKDIADDTGYSISTVSRVLSGSDKISDSTKEKIFSSANKLNYPLVKSINGHEKLLDAALVVSRFHAGEFYSSLYKGFTDAANTDNVVLSIVCISRPRAAFLSLLKRLSKAYDGLILFTPEFNRQDYLEIQNILPQNYPVISNGLIETPVFTTISFDGYSGGYMAAEHFHKKKYTSCAIIKGPMEKTEARYRYNGFKDYIGQNVSQELSWEYNGDFTFQSGAEAYKAFTKLDKKPRAIFACNDAMCHAFLESATRDGYQFPEDISIMGFDDLPVCQHHQPAITSISTPYHKLGQQSLQAVKDEAADKPSNHQQGTLSLLPVSLKVRNSS
jgi:DNA-binding LacI/PurR family transcriptional regulator